MNIKSAFFTISCILLATGAGFAQTTDDQKKESPFKNDPFYTRALEDIFQTSSETDTTTYSNHLAEFKKMNQKGIDIGGVLEAGPYNSNPLYSSYPNLPMFHFNRVDALFLGIRKERMQWYEEDWFLGIPNIQSHGMLGYSFGQDEWQYTIGLEKYFGRDDQVIAGAEYHKATTTDDYWRVGLTESTLTSFFAGYDYLDYYKQQGMGAYLLFRTDRLFEGGLAYSNDRLYSLQPATDWALFGSGNRYRPNPPVDYSNGMMLDEIDLSSVTLSASFNPKRLLLARNFTFSANGTIELGDTGWGESDYGFNKYLTETVTHLNFEPGGILKHRLKIGAITGEAPFIRNFHLGGIGSLRALPYKSLADGNQMLLSNTEAQFGRPKNENSDWIDFEDFYLNIFLDSGWVGFDQELVNSKSPFEGFEEFNFADLKHNAGIGLGSSSLRGELAWDLNNTSRAPVFWLRFNPTF